MIIITCRNEKQLVELLGRFQGEGWSARRWWGEVK
jgi:hypothetical protein